ncbi:MAG: phospho-N-acetylmuramoyl-pentapeptide-transferase, partial [Firmicutes bacterium]|nr:phospho-N-acetylmuramoyl-pentapeptide-transferase [Bacillota bacterium]
MKQAILSFGTALILSTVFTALLIPFLKRNHIGQNIREVGPKHQKKAGTPTMGGMAFVPAIVLAVLP